MAEENINDRILEYLDFTQSPMTLDSISEYFNLSRNRAERALDELIMGGLVLKIFPQNSNIDKRAYYTNAKCKIKEIAIDENKGEEADKHTESNMDMHIEIAQEVINAKDNYTDLKGKIDHIDKNVNGLYANIISIISVFVAIFALITVNANIAFTLTEQNMDGVFTGIVVINLFVVICILILLIGVKLIIINPLIRKKHDTKRKWR